MSTAEREFDVVIFGATGFTGARVLQYAVKTYPGWKVAAAGRNEAKLRATLSDLDITAATIMPGADVNADASLKAMASRARVVLNCVGPYRLFGEPVVAACVATGTDYLDVCGEPEFMERMQLKYHDQAAAAGCLVASAIGFDCMAAEIGAARCCEALATKGATPHHIDSRLTLSWGPAGMGGHFATFESAVHGFGSTNALRALRKEAKAKGLNAPAAVPGPQPPRPQMYEYREEWGCYALPFPGADASVVRRTMAARAGAERPVAHYRAFMTVASTPALYRFLVYGAIFDQLARLSFGRNLLLAAPGLFTGGIFSKAGPTEEQMEGTRFSMTHEAHTFDVDTGTVADRPSVRVEVAGPEPGYVATPIFFVEAAAEVLESRASIAAAVGAGGVFTPGHLLLLHGDGYVDRLTKAGISVSTTVL